MIYILTVHHGTDYWIDIQKKYFDAYIGDYRWIGFLDEVPDSVIDKHRDKFFYLERSNVEKGDYPYSDHHLKMDALFGIANKYADSEDIVIFNDSDAFPIKDIHPLLDKLNEHPLLAVQRLENAGDKCPHCCFAVTTFGFWNDIQGSWKAGLVYNELYPGRQDGGGLLLEKLNSLDIKWYKIRRSNACQIPGDTLFEIYEDSTIYHHGAGSRVPFSIGAAQYSTETGMDMDELLRLRSKKSDEVKQKISSDFYFYKDML